MKKIILFVLLSLTFNAYCQTKDTDPTILEKLFSQEPGSKNKVTQVKEGSRRELTVVGTERNDGFKKYLLTEYNLKEETTNYTYIVSKKGIAPDYDLFKINLSGVKVINFEKLAEGHTEHSNIQGKITVKWKDAEYDMNQPFSKLPLNTTINTEICIDYWWVVWVVETGKIISTEYLGFDCYLFGPAPSTGVRFENPPAPVSCNLSCAEAADAAIAFIGIETPGDISYEAGTTTLTPTGKIRKPLNPRQGLVTLKVLPGFEPEYSAFFKGIVFKEGPNDTDWKWESCTYDYSGLSGGAEPPCIEITNNVKVSDCVISNDKRDAATAISFQFKAAFVCTITIHYGTYYGVSRMYHFDSNCSW